MVRPATLLTVRAPPLPSPRLPRRLAPALMPILASILASILMSIPIPTLIPTLMPVLLALLMAVSGASLAAPASASAPAVQPLSFTALESFGSDSQSILALMQDRQGFIWIGTIDGGLFRYDGHGVVKFINDPANPASLPGARVAALHTDTLGRIWIGTDEGLARYNPETNNFTRFLAGSPGKLRIVRRIIGDGGQGLWLGSWGGLQHFDPASGAFVLYRADDAAAARPKPGALAHNDVNALARDPRGGLWVATWPAGLDYLAPGASDFKHFRVDTPQHPDPRLNDVRALHYDGSGRLWIGTDAGMVLWQDGAPWEQRRRLAGPTSRINSIDADTSGTIWAGTRTEGLQRWDQGSGRFQAYTHRAEDNRSLPGNAINATLEDRSGTLWVGTFTSGVSRANLGNFGFERIVPRDVAPESFPSSNFVRSLGAGANGRVWLGLDDGLALFDPASRRIERHYTARPGQGSSLLHNSIYSVYQQPGGPLWVGTSKGLNRLDQPDGPFVRIGFGAPADDFINTIVPGRHGVLWLGTGGGLMRYIPETGALRVFRHHDADAASRSVNDAAPVLEDGQGRLWVGNYLRGGGLDMARLAELDPGRPDLPLRFQHFRHDPADARSVPGDKITCLYEDLYGTIWVGTTRGLARMVPDAHGQPAFRSYLGAGEPGRVLIESIQGDAAGMLWLTTSMGLSRFDPGLGTFSLYTADDGLNDGFFLGAATRATDGTLYFGSTTGISAVHPALPLRAPSRPQVALTDIRLFDHSLNDSPRPPDVVLQGSVTAPRALTLPWNASVLALEFAALHYGAPARNSYIYRLEGFDRDWVRADASHPVATYTNLYPGSYRFRLRALSNKGLASDEIVLPVTVTPPYWQSWWFRTGAVLLGLMALALLYRVRVRSLLRRARRLETLVAQRTAQLEQSNRKLTVLSATDGLTGLSNRRYFDEMLGREWGRARRNGETLALAMIDVDYFKAYNDHYGHQAGDDCLRQVAAVLGAAAQRSTDVAARYGGEEFALIAPSTSLDDALVIAEAVRAALQALALPHAASPLGCVTVSVGVAALAPGPVPTTAPASHAAPGEPASHQGQEALVLAADQALYRAKQEGRNCVRDGACPLPDRSAAVL